MGPRGAGPRGLGGRGRPSSSPPANLLTIGVVEESSPAATNGETPGDKGAAAPTARAKKPRAKKAVAKKSAARPRAKKGAAAAKDE
jgi:hypothetical protein